MIYVFNNFSDNPETDIYGANLYNRLIEKRRADMKQKSVKIKAHSRGGGAKVEMYEEEEQDDSDLDEDVDNVVHHTENNTMPFPGHFSKRCKSILVLTGVYSTQRDYVSYDSQQGSNHNHRDFALDNSLKQPNYMVENVEQAVNLALEKENFV